MSADLSTAPTSSALSRGITLFWRLLEQQREARRTRQDQRDARDAFMHILRLDERRLDDIGVTRAEVDWAAKLPLEINASKALHARARKRRTAESAGSPSRR